MKTVFRKITPDLMVTDVAKTVKFYNEKLGFKLDMLVPENEKTIATSIEEEKKYVYAMVSRDEVFIMFMQKDIYIQDIPALQGIPVGVSGTFYCEVQNVIGLYEFFKKEGVEIVKNITATWYGMREFYIRDCNGYILGFAEQVNQ
jgi:uncharacterized glyoxalase superfamily protein PhnB